MNQDTRNKKNAKYQQNLQKRYGLTKSSDYKAMCSKGISLSENIKPMTKEFVTTRRHDKIVSREVYTYKWTPEATNARKEYHETKKGIASIPKKPTQVSDKKDKKQLLEERPYSGYHKELVQNLYGSNKAESIAKQQAYKAAHEEKIKKVAKQLEEFKMSKKLQYLEQRPIVRKSILSVIGGMISGRPDTAILVKEEKTRQDRHSMEKIWQTL